MEKNFWVRASSWLGVNSIMSSLAVVLQQRQLCRTAASGPVATQKPTPC
jgi:hypothetical protein